MRETVDVVEPFAAIGVTAFTTTRASGDFAIDPAGATTRQRAQWEALLAALAPECHRLASARQVHGREVLAHRDPWVGWQRDERGGDGHVTSLAHTGLVVTVADCVPVFLAHPSGMVGLLHAGWRGVAGRILEAGLAGFTAHGLAVADLLVHLGPAISGRSYEVGPGVYEQLTGWESQRPRQVDLRALLAEQARSAGVRQISASPFCTAEDNDRFFSHRRGDGERQVAVIVAPAHVRNLP